MIDQCFQLILAIEGYQIPNPDAQKNHHTGKELQLILTFHQHLVL